MKKNRFAVASVIVAMLAVLAIDTHSNCHNTGGQHNCEDNTVIEGTMYWNQSAGNTVFYFIGPARSGQPGLTVDVDHMAEVWEDVSWNGVELPIKMTNQGNTPLQPSSQWDNHNVIGWGPITRTGKTIARCHRRTYHNSHELREADIEFNYYKDFAAHDSPDSNKFCVRNIAAHEIGHMLGLNDGPEYKTSLPISGTNCPDYKPYTMYGAAAKGEHKKVTLRCEDEWALKEKYPIP